MAKGSFPSYNSFTLKEISILYYTSVPLIMLFRRVSRAAYSTGLSQSFIDELLAKAKEATTTTAKEHAARPRSHKQRDLPRGRRFENRGQNRRASGKDGEPRKATTAGLAPTRQGSQRRNAPRSPAGGKLSQPQFSGRAGSVGKGEDLLDVLEGDNTLAGVSGSRTGAARSKTGGKSRRTIRTKPLSPRVTVPGQITPKVQQETQYFYPEEPSPASLLKYSTNLFHCSASKLSNFAVSTLNNANFPVYRHPHVVSGADSFTISEASFNKYVPGYSTIFQKEKLLKNLSVNIDQAKYDATVRGSYAVLPTLQRDNFNTVTKNESSKEKLLANSNVVRLSLLKNPDINANPQVLELLYKTCSGLEPVSSLLNTRSQ